MKPLLYEAFPWWSIIVAAIAGFTVGAVYYGALGKQWVAAQGKSQSDFKPTATPFIISFIAELIMAWMLSGIIGMGGSLTVAAGLIAGLLVWFGFVITTMAVNHAYAGTKPALTLIDGGHWLIVLLIMGAVLGWLAR